MFRSSRRIAAAAGFALVLSAVPAGAGQSYVAASTLTDPAGDVVDINDNPIAEPRADITSASADYSQDEIAFTLRVAQPTNPATDPNWVGGASVVGWALDTDGDGNIDYQIILTRGGAAIAAGVTDLADPPNFLCQTRSAMYTSALVYAATIDPACVGNPSSARWGAMALYDTNPADANSPIAIDLAPDAAPDAGPIQNPAAPQVGSGYWMLGSTGEVYAFGKAQNYGNELAATVKRVDIEPTPSGNGYWILAESGAVHNKGDATWLGSALSTLQPGEKAAALSSTPTGQGYWIFTDKGRALALGDAVHHGDMSAVTLNGPVLDSVATPSGHGYWMVASDGGIFSFGDAKFYGSTGDKVLNKPVMSMAPDPDGVGYWLVASDGGIFAFAAPFYGSMGSTPLNKPVSGLVQGSNGYLMVAEDGGIFAFGNVPFHGSLGANPPANPVVAVALKVS